MEGDMSLGVVVLTIMESLSDAVTGLLLMVIGLQEENASVPQHVPETANAVTEASHTLVRVARGLATDEYDEFPEIAQPILACAADLEASAKGLLESVAFITTSHDRAAGWERLLGSCRSISFETVRILQIVYGAELKRLTMAIERTLQAADDNGDDKDDLISSNPEEFLRKAEELGEWAGDLGKYVSEYNEEAPDLKDQFREIGEALQEDAQELVNKTNDLLQRPEDSRARKDFQDRVQAIKKRTQQLAKPIQDKIKNMPMPDWSNDNSGNKKDNDDQGDHSLPPLLHADVPQIAAHVVEELGRVAAKEAKPERKDDFKAAAENLQNYIDNLNSPTSSDDVDDEDVLDQLVDAQEALVQEIKEKAEAGKQDEVAKLVKDLTKRNNDIIAKTKQLLENEPEPEKKEMMHDALKDMEDQVPAIIAAATDLATKKSPPGKAKEKLQEATKPYVKNLKYVRQPKKNDLVKERDAVFKLKIGKGKPRDLANNGGSELDGALGRLRRTARDLNNPNGDNDGPNWLAGRDIANAIAELERRLAGKGKRREDEVTTPGFKNAIDRFEQGVNKLKDDPRAQLAGDIHDMNRAMDRLDASLDKGPGKPSVNAMKHAGGKKDNVVQRAKAIGDRTADPKKKKQIADATQRLENLFQKEVDAVKKYIKDPSSQNKEEAQVIGSQIKEALADIADAALDNPETRVDALIAKEKAAVAELARLAKQEGGNKQNLDDIIKVAQDTRDKLAEMVREYGDKDPLTKDRLARSLADVDRHLADVIKTAKDAADGRNKDEALAALNEAVSRLDPALDKLGDDLKEAIKGDAAKQSLAALKAKDLRKMNAGDLLAASRRLAGLLGNMVGKIPNSTGQTGPGTGAGTAGSSGGDVSSSSRSAAGGPSSRYGAGSGKSSGASAPSSSSLSSGGAGGSFGGGFVPVVGGGIASIVKQIQQQNVGIEDSMGSLSLDLASELQKLAEAVKAGAKHDLIAAGRAIGALINKYCDETRKVANACRDPVLRNRLLHNASALRTFGPQIKIMASVRAASLGTGGNAEQMLSDMAQEIGNLVAGVSTTVGTIRTSKRF
eukprot:TRINITY_DN4079_c0_g1_i6.p1 TRINITY_DN4079_c0_g1~~TRINITY_DN4079_c0_g1_i6.p1  ORF type:complete len:1069 (+),score=279.59 TRINITY_DN4079_c0_g1_i6:111-3317(+)